MLGISHICLCLFLENSSILNEVPILGQAPSRIIKMFQKLSIQELNPKKILIRSTNWIGDAVMTTPAVHTIRKNFPESEITLLAVPWVADIFSMSSDIDVIMLYDKKDLYRGKVRGPLLLAKDLKSQHFDAAFLLQNAFEAAIIAKMAAIPIRAGYKRDGRGVLLSHGVNISNEIRKKHQVHYYQNMLGELGLTPGADDLRVPISNEMNLWANECIESLNAKRLAACPDVAQEDSKGSSQSPQPQQNTTFVPVIGFSPGAAFGPAKRWPVEKFAQLAAIIAHAYREHGCVIMIFGTGDDTETAQAIQEFSIHTPLCVYDMTGKTDLKQAMALINCCDAFVTNDSGLMHVAAGLNTPVLAIFGSTDHIATSPFSKQAIIIRREMECSPCLQTHCPKGHLECLESISAKDVFKKLKQILHRNFDTDAQ